VRVERGNPVGVRMIVSGQPTVRRAQLPGGNRMTEKRNAGSRKAAGNRDVMTGSSGRWFRATGRIRDFVPGLKGR